MKLFVWVYPQCVVAMAETLEEARAKVKELSLAHWSKDYGDTAHDWIINEEPAHVYDTPKALVIWADIYDFEK